MNQEISQSDARLALHAVEQSRRHIIAEIDLPRWYWWGLAAGWVLLGVASDEGSAWVVGGATLVFGAVHAAVAQRLFSGRRKSSRLTVRAGVVDHRLPLVLFGCLVALGAITVGLGFAADADGARHASTFASLVPAVAIVCGGPSLMAAVRRRAERTAR